MSVKAKRIQIELCLRPDVNVFKAHVIVVSALRLNNDYCEIVTYDMPIATSDKRWVDLILALGENLLG